MKTITRRGRSLLVAPVLALAMVAAACGTEEASNDDATASTTTDTTSTTGAADGYGGEGYPDAGGADAPGTSASSSVRESGMTVTTQQVGDVTVHTLTAPEQVFANSTHIIETENSLVLVDTQFLLPNAADFRAYADSLDKPIDRVFITHSHPDHFLGSEVFADLPVFALAEVSAAIAANGDAEIAEKQGEFGPEAIAGTFVVPVAVEPGTVEIDGVSFELTAVADAEADIQLVIRVPESGVIATGDIVYSGVHLILAGAPDTWTAALQDLAANGDMIVLPGHGLPAGNDVFDENIDWLATAGQLLGTVDNGEDFKQGLLDAYPELGMSQAIDFVLPFLFPQQ